VQTEQLIKMMLLRWWRRFSVRRIKYDGALPVDCDVLPIAYPIVLPTGEGQHALTVLLELGRKENRDPPAWGHRLWFNICAEGRTEDAKLLGELGSFLSCRRELSSFMIPVLAEAVQDIVGLAIARASDPTIPPEVWQKLGRGLVAESRRTEVNLLNNPFSGRSELVMELVTLLKSTKMLEADLGVSEVTPSQVANVWEAAHARCRQIAAQRGDLRARLPTIYLARPGRSAPRGMLKEIVSFNEAETKRMVAECEELEKSHMAIKDTTDRVVDAMRRGFVAREIDWFRQDLERSLEPVRQGMLDGKYVAPAVAS
jgi:hypothetical protein